MSALAPKTGNGGRLIQSTYNTPKYPGNFEAVVLEKGGPNGKQLVHYWRDSTNPKLPWYRGPVISTTATSAGSLIQSTYGVPKYTGNFELLVLEGKNVVHYWRDNSNPNNTWYKGPIVSSQATGAPSFIQGDYV